MKTIIYICLFTLPFIANGQIFNDECVNATYLGSIQEFCTDEGLFSNVNAGESSQIKPNCTLNTGFENDVWFSFAPQAPGVLIQVIGGNGASLQSPSVAIYEASCTNVTEIGCGRAGVNINLVEVTVTDLIVGGIYLIRVDGRNGDEGDFRICINSFVPVPSPQSDCDEAVVLCDKSSFSVENINTAGNDNTELSGHCTFSNGSMPSEDASVWYTWTCDVSGTLEFTLTPNNPNNTEEDLDFVVFELPNGIGDCSNKISLRCMFSGETGGAPASQNAPCFGATGMMEGDPDVFEQPGCQPGDNNFVSAINMVSGTSYALVINNYSQSGFGFGIDWGGTGTFLGPEPDFDFDIVGNVIECEKEVMFEDMSNSVTDPIVSYQWSFGVGAEPIQATGIGPHSIEYASFGEKVATLTVESSRGCTVTKFVDVFVEPCCKDTTTLGIGLVNARDVLCFGETSGEIEITGLMGAPQYQYSIDGVNFQPNPQFLNLPAEDYQLYVQDIKGCLDTIDVSLAEPPPILVDAGPDITIDLGFTGQLLGAVQGAGGNVTVSWNPPNGLDDPSNLTPTAVGAGVGSYTLTIVDENGCTVRDMVQVTVNEERPLYFPNIISPDGDSNNRYFNIFGGPAFTQVKNLKVYDRWGNLVYEGENIPRNSLQDGWNGDFTSSDVNPGVFAWLASVEWIDGKILDYSGSVTVVR